MRSVGVNYNQVVKAIHTTFSERRAAALLARLEKHTQEFCELERQVINLTREYRAKWSAE